MVKILKRAKHVYKAAKIHQAILKKERREGCYLENSERREEKRGELEREGEGEDEDEEKKGKRRREREREVPFRAIKTTLGRLPIGFSNDEEVSLLLLWIMNVETIEVSFVTLEFKSERFKEVIIEKTPSHSEIPSIKLPFHSFHIIGCPQTNCHEEVEED
jgi:hypothetical protein